MDPRVQGETVMSGPKLPNVEAHNLYAPVGKKVQGELAMTGPVFQVHFFFLFLKNSVRTCVFPGG